MVSVARRPLDGPQVDFHRFSSNNIWRALRFDFASSVNTHLVPEVRVEQ